MGYQSYYVWYWVKCEFYFTVFINNDYIIYCLNSVSSTVDDAISWIRIKILKYDIINLTINFFCAIRNKSFQHWNKNFNSSIASLFLCFFWSRTIPFLVLLMVHKFLLKLRRVRNFNAWEIKLIVLFWSHFPVTFSFGNYSDNKFLKSVCNSPD